MTLFLIITGMHRSGTSFLARAFNLIGVNLGDYESLTTTDLEFNPDNLRGHWENRKFLELAEKTLALNNCSWDNAPKSIKISDEIGNEVKRCATELSQKQALAVGFKDPRILLYLDSWKKYLPKDILIIGIFRHPLKVAESLKTRNQFSYKKSLELWETYNQKLLYFLEKFDGFLLDFDKPKKELLLELKLIAEKLGLAKDIELNEWYSEELFHSDKTYNSDYNLPLDIVNLYKKLKQRSKQNMKFQKNISRSKQDLNKIIDGLFAQIKSDSNYYKKLFGEMPQKINLLETGTKKFIKNEKVIKEKNLQIQSELSHLKSELSHLKSSLTDKESELSHLKSSLTDKESELSHLKSSLTDKESENLQMQSALESAQQQILNIHQSFVFRMLHKYDKTLGKVLPIRPKKYLPSQKVLTEDDRSAIIKKALTNIHLTKKDILCFPIINWDYRYQRPQHIISKFAENNHRIFYLTVNMRNIEREYEIKELKKNIYQVEFNFPKFFDIYKDKFDKVLVSEFITNFEKMKEDLKIDAISFVQFPTWQPLVQELKRQFGYGIIFDCLDEFTGFSNVIKEREKEEKILFRNSDLTTCSSKHLKTKIMKETTKLLFLPNAGEFDHFHNVPDENLLKDYKNPIIGYFGSIAEWFDTHLLEYVVQKRPNWTFIFIGHTFGSDIRKLKEFENVHFLGERPYSELPKYFHGFDVCLIPFRNTPLIEATHPVKIYEYLAAGKPVVTTKLKELEFIGNLCYITKDKEEFLEKLDKAVNEDDEQLRKDRIDFASKNTWNDRFNLLYTELQKNSSLEILHHN